MYLGQGFKSSLNLKYGKENYKDKLLEVKALYKRWLKRLITPLGRVAVLKSLILSKLTHLWMLLPNPPDPVVKELQIMCFKFVWNMKQDRISRKIAVQDVKSGGMNMPDISSLITALKLTWIKRIRTSKHKWKDIAILNCPELESIEKYTPNYLLKNKK